MKTAVASLKSLSPYGQSKHYVVDKLPGEQFADYERRTWRGRAHVNEDGLLFIPPMAFKNCISEVAKYLGIKIPGKRMATFTKHFEAGVLVVDPLTLPVKLVDVEGHWQHVPSDGRRGGSTRVDKCFPVIRNWHGDVSFLILDQTILTIIPTPEGEMTAFEYHLRQAGSFIGIGLFRPRNNGYWGRFTVESLKIL